MHFLNQVDEADLLKLMDEEEVAEFTKPIEETKPEVLKQFLKLQNRRGTEIEALRHQDLCDADLRPRRKKRDPEHAIKSAELINQMNPEYASFLTLRLYEGTQMNEEVKRGEMELITPDEIVEEMELFLTHIDSPGTIFRTNHASNYVVLAGTFNEDIPKMLAQLEDAKKRQRYRLEEWRRHI